MIIDYVSAVDAKRYRYTTIALSLNDFYHTTGKVLEITTSLTERSDKSGWGSGSGSITEVTVGPNTYELSANIDRSRSKNSPYTSRCMLTLPTSAQIRTLRC